MALNQDYFLNNQDDDLRRSTDNDVSANNDELGENSEQTPVAKAQGGMSSDTEKKGWNNNQPGVTTDSKSDQRVPTTTPQNDNGIPGPDDDYGDEDDDDELIPIENDDDDILDDDDDDENINDSTHIDVSAVIPDTDRSFGRTTGRMIDHEPGTTNNP